MTKFTKAITFVVAVIALSLCVFPVAAQIKPIQQGDCSQLGIACSGSETPADLINKIMTVVNALLVLVGIVASIYFVMGGVRYIMSEGETDQAAQAKRTMLYAIIGILVIGLSALIVNFAVDIASGKNGVV